MSGDLAPYKHIASLQKVVIYLAHHKYFPDNRTIFGHIYGIEERPFAMGACIFADRETGGTDDVPELYYLEMGVANAEWRVGIVHTPALESETLTAAQKMFMRWTAYAVNHVAESGTADVHAYIATCQQSIIYANQ